MNHIYLDFAATTPVDERVIAAMLPYLDQDYGNPSSVHRFGQRADLALETSRRRVAEQINASPSEIIFTSCGSESDNLALRGVTLAAKRADRGNHLLVSAIEHPAVLETAQQLGEFYGIEIGLLASDRDGLVSTAELASQLRDDTVLVSVMGANNEIGTINPLAELGAICQEKGVPFHTDAVQYAAHLPLDVEKMGLDLVSLGAHKFYGPKGVGALYIRRGSEVIPSLTGGSQEFGLRAATQNIPSIVGMAEAFHLVQSEMDSRHGTSLHYRDQIIDFVLDRIPDSQLTGHPHLRLPNHASFVFKSLDGNLLIQVLDAAGFGCSSGSACKTGDPKPSAVLTALGYDSNWSLGSLRITVGKGTLQTEIERFLEILPGCVEQVRGLSK